VNILYSIYSTEMRCVFLRLAGPVRIAQIPEELSAAAGFWVWPTAGPGQTLRQQIFA